MSKKRQRPDESTHRIVKELGFPTSHSGYVDTLHPGKKFKLTGNCYCDTCLNDLSGIKTISGDSPRPSTGSRDEEVPSDYSGSITGSPWDHYCSDSGDLIRVLQRVERKSTTEEREQSLVPGYESRLMKYGRERRVRYCFPVDPGADPKDYRCKYCAGKVLQWSQKCPWIIKLYK